MRNPHIPPAAGTRTGTQPRHGTAGMSTGRRQQNLAASRRLPPRSRGKGRIRLCSTTLMPLTGKWLHQDPGERHWVARSQHRAIPRVTLTQPAATGKYMEGLQHPAPLRQDPTPKTSQDGRASCVRCQPGAGQNTRQKSGCLGQSGCRVVGAARLQGQSQADKGAGAVSKGKRAAPLPAA